MLRLACPRCAWHGCKTWPLPRHALRFLESVLQPLWRVMPSAALYQRGLEIQVRYKLSFYDALIVAAALEAGCKRLFSEDLQHGMKIEKLVVRNPFLPG